MSANASEEFSKIQQEIYRHGYDRGREDTIAKVKTAINVITQEYIDKYGSDIIELYADVVTEFKEWLEKF